MSFIFKDKSEVNITYKTTFISDENKYIQIYEYYDETQRCNKYFTVTYPEGSSRDITFIAYFVGNDLYIVNIKDDMSSEELLRQRQALLDDLKNEGFENSKSMSRVPKFVIMRKIKKIKNMKMIKLFMCAREMDLGPAKEKLSELTSNMKRVTKNDTINFDLHYIYNVEEHSKISSYNNYGDMLLLCLYSKDQCIGSLLIEYGAKNKEIKIDSKTNEIFRGRKINKLLRSVIVIIGEELIGSANGVVLSFPINPVSAHIMIKHLNGIPLDTKRRVMDIKTYKEIEDAIETAKLSKVVIELNKPENIENANDIFMKCLKDAAFDFRPNDVRAALQGTNKLKITRIGKSKRRRTKKRGSQKQENKPSKPRTTSKSKSKSIKEQYKN